MIKVQKFFILAIILFYNSSGYLYSMIPDSNFPPEIDRMIIDCLHNNSEEQISSEEEIKQQRILGRLSQVSKSFKTAVEASRSNRTLDEQLNREIRAYLYTIKDLPEDIQLLHLEKLINILLKECHLSGLKATHIKTVAYNISDKLAVRLLLNRITIPRDKQEAMLFQDFTIFDKEVNLKNVKSLVNQKTIELRSISERYLEEIKDQDKKNNLLLALERQESVCFLLSIIMGNYHDNIDKSIIAAAILSHKGLGYTKISAMMLFKKIKCDTQVIKENTSFINQLIQSNLLSDQIVTIQKNNILHLKAFTQDLQRTTPENLNFEDLIQIYSFARKFVNEKNEYGFTPLMIAVLADKPDNFINMLIALGARL